MNTTDKNSDARTAWNERMEHERIMNALRGVYGETGSYFYINGYYYYWTIHELPEGEPERIAERGCHEEILYMIHQYGRTICKEDRYLHNYAWSAHGNEGGALLSDKVQEIILKRNNPEEILAYTTYHGFAPAGQDIILDRGNHTEIMIYLQRHGFAPAQQVRLWQRGNQEEIDLHIKNHGCSAEMLEDMFADMSQGSAGEQQFLHFIGLHELPVAYQIRMVKTVNSDLFMTYINKYGLWFEAHADMVRERSVEEIMAYIDRHRMLSDEGERQLAYRHVTRLTQHYLEKRVDKKRTIIFNSLIKAVPVDTEALETFFITREYSDYDVFSSEKTCELMENGSSEDVLKYIEDNQLGMKALSCLFFRERRDEFFAYVKRRMRS